MTTAAARQRNREKTARYKINHPDRVKGFGANHRAKHARSIRSYKLRIAYGITADDYDALLASQEGHCVFCARTTGGQGKRLYVDHDHTTKRIRGLLCHIHNQALSHFGDNEVGLQQALNYVKGP